MFCFTPTTSQYALLPNPSELMEDNLKAGSVQRLHDPKDVYVGTRYALGFKNLETLVTYHKQILTIIIIIDSMTSVFNTNASLPYKHDLFESLLSRKE
ncbi:hypothetical protein T265_10823 [Opisthorchis viverrini]|uniref:Uncharacterized protein n=1 Tax=Opisthorchis viverrini TaxID=6198 RepID=A0A074Z5A1_OPIVI|nr:hypothetical protein T265_10823 [Opisthorchis viverrini]KER20692.1 hypothetical protein T265_10823 [Opisthorchis viverrini]